MPTADWSPASRSDFTVRTRFFFYLSRIVSRTCLFSAKFQKSVEQSSLSKKATSDCNSCITCYPGDFFSLSLFFNESAFSNYVFPPCRTVHLCTSLDLVNCKLHLQNWNNYGIKIWWLSTRLSFFSISLDHIYKREREQILIRTNVPSH